MGRFIDNARARRAERRGECVRSSPGCEPVKDPVDLKKEEMARKMQEMKDIAVQTKQMEKYKNFVKKYSDANAELTSNKVSGMEKLRKLEAIIDKHTRILQEGEKSPGPVIERQQPKESRKEIARRVVGPVIEGVREMALQASRQGTRLEFTPRGQQAMEKLNSLLTEYADQMRDGGKIPLEKGSDQYLLIRKQGNTCTAEITSDDTRTQKTESNDRVAKENVRFTAQLLAEQLGTRMKGKEMIPVNDHLRTQAVNALKAAIKENFPGRTVITQSFLDEIGLGDRPDNTALVRPANNAQGFEIVSKEKIAREEEANTKEIGKAVEKLRPTIAELKSLMKTSPGAGEVGGSNAMASLIESTQKGALRSLSVDAVLNHIEAMNGGPVTMKNDLTGHIFRLGATTPQVSEETGRTTSASLVIVDVTGDHKEGGGVSLRALEGTTRNAFKKIKRPDLTNPSLSTKDMRDEKKVVDEYIENAKAEKAAIQAKIKGLGKGGSSQVPELRARLGDLSTQMDDIGGHQKRLAAKLKPYGKTVAENRADEARVEKAKQGVAKGEFKEAAMKLWKVSGDEPTDMNNIAQELKYLKKNLSKLDKYDDAADYQKFQARQAKLTEALAKAVSGD